MLTVLKRGTKSTIHALRILHNFALNNGWLHWHILSKNQWPTFVTKPQRGITHDEHIKILAAEMNEERRNYYEMLWLIGAAQTDCSLLTAENVDWPKKTISYKRKKTGEWCHLRIGNDWRHFLKNCQHRVSCFRKSSPSRTKTVRAEFCRLLRLLGITGVSLHSYRYGWASALTPLAILKDMLKPPLDTQARLFTEHTPREHMWFALR